MDNATIAYWAQVISGVFFLWGLSLMAERYLPRVRAWVASARPASSSPVSRGRPEVEHAPTEGYHLLLAGATGSGKSAAARELIRRHQARDTHVLVLDPDGASWPRGCEMVGAPDDFDAMHEKLRSVQQRATERRAAFMRGVRQFPGLLIVVDEAAALFKNIPDTVNLINDLGARGRKLNISVILLFQTTAARVAGLERMSAILTNFERIDVARHGNAVTLTSKDRAAPITLTLRPETDLVLPTFAPDASDTEEAARLLRTALDTPVTVRADAGAAIPVSRTHHESAAFAADVAIPVSTGMGGIGQQNAVSADTSDTGSIPGIFDAETIRALSQLGWSRNKIAQRLTGAKQRRLETIAAALEASEPKTQRMHD